jgi:hypothetical protein
MDNNYEIIHTQHSINTGVVLSEILKIKKEIGEIKDMCNKVLNKVDVSHQNQIELISTIKEIISNNHDNLKELYRGFDNLVI